MRKPCTIPDKKLSVEMSGKMSGKVFAILRDNAHATIPDIAIQLGVTTRTIERDLTTLQHEGRVVRIGPTKGGHWKVLGSQ
jgi:ATP-dependent DNA helicase RecG